MTNYHISGPSILLYFAFGFKLLAFGFRRAVVFCLWLSAFASQARCLRLPERFTQSALLFRFVFRFGGAGGFDPRVPSAFQSAHLLVAFVEEHLRHTGASVLARSGTVDDDLAVARNLTQARFDFVHRNAHRTFDFNLTVVVRTRTARVNDEDRRVLGELGFQLLNRDARDFAFRLVLGSWRLGDGL